MALFNSIEKVGRMVVPTPSTYDVELECFLCKNLTPYSLKKVNKPVCKYCCYYYLRNLVAIPRQGGIMSIYYYQNRLLAHIGR